MAVTRHNNVLEATQHGHTLQVSVDSFPNGVLHLRFADHTVDTAFVVQDLVATDLLGIITRLSYILVHTDPGLRETLVSSVMRVAKEY